MGSLPFPFRVVQALPEVMREAPGLELGWPYLTGARRRHQALGFTLTKAGQPIRGRWPSKRGGTGDLTKCWMNLILYIDGKMRELSRWTRAAGGAS